MTKNKPIISILMACLLLFGVFGWTVTARAEIASGTCGTCNWVIDDEGTLTISPADGTSGTLDSISSNQSWPWFSNRTSIKKVIVEEGVAASADAVGMFGAMTKCTDFQVGSLDTSATTNMANMFTNCTSLVDTSGLARWDTGNVTNMNSMFNGCTSLADTSAFADWDTGKVTDMSSVFNDCALTGTSDFANWDTSNATTMSGMFSNCRSLSDTSDLANWDTSNVTNMRNMFGN